MCVGRLKQGRIDKIRHHDFPMKEADRRRGDFLLCSYTASTPEVVIEAEEATGGGDIPWQTIEARLRKLEWLSADVAALAVQTPRTSRLRFLPGQNVRLTLSEGIASDLPIASCPCDDRNIEFHLRNDPDDSFCAAVFGVSRFPTAVRIDGPWGVAPGSDRNKAALCLAYDTCIAPLRSWIELQLADDSSQSISLYWCAGDDSGFYLAKLFNAWSDAFDTFSCQLTTTDDPAHLPQPLVDRICSELDLAADNTRVLVAGPGTFTGAVKALLEKSNHPKSDRYIHSVAGAPSLEI